MYGFVTVVDHLQQKRFCICSRLLAVHRHFLVLPSNTKEVKQLVPRYITEEECDEEMICLLLQKGKKNA